MNLLALRQKFKVLTGRYDLVNSDGSDNGADFLINEAQKYLDMRMDNSNSIGRVFKDVNAGKFLVTFQDCRSILEVWCVGDDSAGNKVRLPLEKKTMVELRGVDRKTLTQGYTALFGNITPSRPQYYAPAQLRLKTDDGTTGGIGGFMDVLANGAQSYNGVLFMPPTDANYTIEVIGNFFTMALTNDDDSSYWSDRHPSLLIMATMRMIEVFNRNSEGVKDWERSIDLSIMDIDMDAVKEECADVTQMEG